MLLAGCLGIVTTLAAGELPSLPAEVLSTINGQASYYGLRLHGRRTASGEILDRQQFTAASNHFPLGALVLVRRPGHPVCAIVRINDRMHRRHRVRVIDVTHGVARALSMLQAGVVRVEVQGLPGGAYQTGSAPCDNLAVLAAVPVVAGVTTSCMNCADKPLLGLAGEADDVDDNRGFSTAPLPSSEVLLQ